MKRRGFTGRKLVFAIGALVGVTLLGAGTSYGAGADGRTATPIKHVVVIFQENVSFDHYFGTYPWAANPPGEPAFQARNDTPRVNNLVTSGLLTNNPNAANPFRIDRSVPNTCDQDHDYGDEQKAFDGGLMDKFVESLSCDDSTLGAASTMGYYDGNTVTALWNYAQYFAMSDNHYGTTFGPSTPGALNLIAGQTYGASIMNGGSGAGFIADGASNGALIGDADPYGDACSNPKRTQVTMSEKNVGDLLNQQGVTWGAFMGGFADCAASHTGATGLTSTDYIPHHAWFQYYASTRNVDHLPPSSAAMIGQSDQANHQYDLSDFFTALAQHNLPAVSFLKADAFADGHAGYSDPLDEQIFLVSVINKLMASPEWKNTAVIITWDDSDGWYDHQMGPIVRQSNVSDDQLLGPGNCGSPKPNDIGGGEQNGRCGFGPRIPLLVISPFAKANYVDHAVLDQSSILRFIEDNWNLGRLGNGSTDAVAGSLDGMFDFEDVRHAGRRLILNPQTGQPTAPQGGESH